jgi:F-type H+-transporting ATPase subunit epsilon
MSESLPDVLRLKVITPHRLVVDEHVTEVSLPGLEGELGILPGHRPFLTVLGEGFLSFKGTGREDRIEVSGGYAEIERDSVLVFTQLKANEKDTVDSGRG